MMIEKALVYTQPMYIFGFVSGLAALSSICSASKEPKKKKNKMKKNTGDLGSGSTWK